MPIDLFKDLQANLKKDLSEVKPYKSWDKYEFFLKDVFQPGWTTKARHIQEICGSVDDLIARRTPRVAVHMPPRHGKSETLTIHLPVYWLLRYPTSNVLVVSHTADMAKEFGQKTRKIMADSFDLVRYDKRANQDWKTTLGGGYHSCGWGSPPTGRGFDLIIIDDPIKKREEVESMVQVEKKNAEYMSNYHNRLAPGGRMVLVGTQWSPFDIYTFAVNLCPEMWKVLKFPAISEAGEALWPEMWPVDVLLQKKQEYLAAGEEVVWEALYQQNPQPKSGVFFRIEKIKRIKYGELYKGIMNYVRSWDVAYSKDKGDYTVGVLWGIDYMSEPYIIDVVRGRWESGERDTKILQTARNDPDGTLIVMPQDPAAGAAQIVSWAKLLASFSFKFVKVGPRSGSKMSRADPLASFINMHGLKMVENPFSTELLTEFSLFPQGHDDIVDAAAQGFSEIALALSNDMTTLNSAVINLENMQGDMGYDPKYYSVSQRYSKETTW